MSAAQQDLEQLGHDLLGIFEDEAKGARAELTADRQARIRFELAMIPQLAAEAAAGKDVSAKVMGVKALLLDDAAIVTIVIARGAERAFARGLEMVGRWLATFARGLLMGALGAPAR